VAQLMPLPLTVSCFSKIQIGFTFLVSAHPGSPGKRAVKRVCVCVLLIQLDHSYSKTFSEASKDSASTAEEDTVVSEEEPALGMQLILIIVDYFCSVYATASKC